MKTALIYARVSSDKQREEHTIASQTAALRVFAQEQGFSVPDEWVIEDEGYSGATLVRPGLERVRDLVAEGQVDAVLDDRFRETGRDEASIHGTGIMLADSSFEKI